MNIFQTFACKLLEEFTRETNQTHIFHISRRKLINFSFCQKKNLFSFEINWSDQKSYLSLSVPAKVHNLRIARVGSDSVTVAWEHPKDPYTKMEEFQIQYSQKQKPNTTQNVFTTNFNHTFPGLQLQTEYVFMVSFVIHWFSPFTCNGVQLWKESDLAGWCRYRRCIARALVQEVTNVSASLFSFISRKHKMIAEMWPISMKWTDLWCGQCKQGCWRMRCRWGKKIQSVFRLFLISESRCWSSVYGLHIHGADNS